MYYDPIHRGDITSLVNARKYALKYLKQTPSTQIIYVMDRKTDHIIGKIYWKEAGFNESTYVYETDSALFKLYNDGKVKAIKHRVRWIKDPMKMSYPVRTRGFN